MNAMTDFKKIQLEIKKKEEEIQILKDKLNEAKEKGDILL